MKFFSKTITRKPLTSLVFCFAKCVQLKNITCEFTMFLCFFSLASRSCIIFGILFGWLWFKKKTQNKKTEKIKKKRGIFHLMKYIFWQLSTNTFSFLLSPERLDSTSLNWTKLTDREDQCCVDVIQETSEHFPLMFLFSWILYYYLVVFFLLHYMKKNCRWK